MTDLERSLRAAFHDEAVVVDTTLDYPGDPVPARPRRRRLLAVVGSVAASVALVGGAVWGSGHVGGSPAAVEPAYVPVHTRADVPRAVQLLPGVLAGIDRLQPVEDAALRTCLRAKGSDGPRPGERVLQSLTRSTDLDPATAGRTGYGLEGAIRAERAQTTWSASMAGRFGARWEDAYDLALIGPVDSTWVKRTIGRTGEETRYGGCLAQVRRTMWGADEMARLDMDLLPTRNDPTAVADGHDPALEPVQAAWTECLRRDGAAGLIERSQVRAGIPRGGNDFADDVDIEFWKSTMVLQLGRDLNPSAATVRAALADEKALAAVDARCVQETGLRAATAASAARSDGAPAHLLEQDPRLLDEVFDLDVSVRRLLADHHLG